MHRYCFVLVLTAGLLATGGHAEKPKGVVFTSKAGKSTAAAASSSGSVSFAGKTIAWKVSGDSAARGEANADAKKCTVQIDIDGTKHEVVITREMLEYKKEKIALKTWKKMEFIGEGEKIRILVDGRQVFPADKK